MIKELSSSDEFWLNYDDILVILCEHKILKTFYSVYKIKKCTRDMLKLPQKILV